MSLLRRSHGDRNHTATKGASLAKGPALTIGILLVAAGILGMTADGTTPPGSNFPDGSALGSEVLGVETNGWTNVLLVGSGALLLLGAAKHWGAKVTSLLVGLALLAAAAFSFFNDDVLGLGASNGWTELLLAAAGGALLITALLPRLGHKDHHTDHGHREERLERPAQHDGTVTHHDDGVDVRTGRFAREEPVVRQDGAVSGDALTKSRAERH